MSIYDKAKWHFEGDFSKDLPIYQGFVHIGFYLGWVIEHNFAGELLTEDFPEEIDQFRSGKITGTRLLQITDGALDDQMLSEEGNRFTADYYENNDHGYNFDYAKTFPGEDSIYHVQDTPENFAKIKNTLDARYKAWRAKQ